MSGTALDFDALALLESLRGRGAVVSVKGDGVGAWLHVAPRSVLSDSERADFRQHKRELIALLESQPVHRWQSAATGDTATPDKSATAATGDLSAIAPDVAPDLSPDEAAALLARYRRGGATLSLETVNGARALAVEVPARFTPDKRERAFAMLENNGLAIYRALEMETQTQ